MCNCDSEYERLGTDTKHCAVQNHTLRFDACSHNVPRTGSKSRRDHDQKQKNTDALQFQLQRTWTATPWQIFLQQDSKNVTWQKLFERPTWMTSRWSANENLKNNWNSEMNCSRQMNLKPKKFARIRAQNVFKCWFLARAGMLERFWYNNFSQNPLQRRTTLVNEMWKFTCHIESAKHVKQFCILCETIFVTVNLAITVTFLWLKTRMNPTHRQVECCSSGARKTLNTLDFCGTTNLQDDTIMVKTALSLDTVFDSCRPFYGVANSSASN